MDHKESRLISILFFSATFVFFAGCFFREFLIYIWTSTMQVYTVGHGPYLAIALMMYLIMFGVFGAATGLVVHHKAHVIKANAATLCAWIKGNLSWCKQSICKAKAR